MNVRELVAELQGLGEYCQDLEVYYSPSQDRPAITASQLSGSEKQRVHICIPSAIRTTPSPSDCARLEELRLSSLSCVLYLKNDVGPWLLSLYQDHSMDHHKKIQTQQEFYGEIDKAIEARKK